MGLRVNLASVSGEEQQCVWLLFVSQSELRAAGSALSEVGPKLDFLGSLEEMNAEEKWGYFITICSFLCACCVCA